MEFQEIISKLEELGTEQNRKVYKKHGAGDNQFGVSFSNLRALKKQVVSPRGKKGEDLELSMKLWKTGNTDARIFACLISPPGEINEEELQNRVQDIHYYMLADVFGEMVSRTPFAMKLAEDWINNNREYISRSGFVTLNHLAMNQPGIPDEYFNRYVKMAEQKLQQLPNRAKEGFNNLLIAIGARNEILRDSVLQAAKKIGRVEIDHGDTNCKTLIIEEYLEKIYKRNPRRST